MLHVVHVIHSLDVGGTENGLVNLMNAHAGELRQSVVAITMGGALGDRLPTGVALHCLRKRPGIDMRCLVRLIVLLRRLRPDIVHSRNWGAFDAVPAARLARVPVVIHGEHGREAADPHGLNPKRRRVRRVLGPLVDRFVAVSHDLRRWLIDVVGLPAPKVLTIHNGVDTGRFSGDGREAGRAALGAPPGAVVVGTVGRLDPVKDQAGLLEAFARVQPGHPGARLVVVGEGPCRAELMALTATLGIGPRVRFLGERTDVPLLLKGMDLFVLPSIAEGISNTILEAMATGLPVIATRAGGNPELVEDGITGALVPARDRAALAEVLAAYLRDSVRRAARGAAGRRRATAHFDLGRMATEYRQLYLDLARHKGVA